MRGMQTSPARRIGGHGAPNLRFLDNQPHPRYVIKHTLTLVLLFLVSNHLCLFFDRNWMDSIDRSHGRFQPRHVDLEKRLVSI